MNSIKRSIVTIPVLGPWARAIYRAVYRLMTYEFKEADRQTYDPPSKWITALLTDRQLDVVQIGSNDGATNDPISELINGNTHWRAIFVEPVPYLFESLKRNKGNDKRFTFENVALNDGTAQTFYSVQSAAKDYIPNLPAWYDQLGSFNRSNITNQLNGVLEPFIVENTIAGITLTSLLEQNQVKSLELLHLDTEGYDWKILSNLDLTKHKPSVILFEHKLLSRRELRDSTRFLKPAYKIFRLGIDTLCVRKDLMSVDGINTLRGVLVNE